MRGFRMGAMIASAMAAITAGFGRLDFRPQPAHPAATKAGGMPMGHGYRSKGQPRKDGRSGQHADKARLLVDRSSSVRKMQRWLRAGTMLAPAPKTDRHLMRHGWYRRDLEKKARAEAGKAWRNE